VEQLAQGGYYTVLQVHREENVVKLGEASGLGIKKARQLKQSIATYVEEKARANLIPEVQPATPDGEPQEPPAAPQEPPADVQDAPVSGEAGPVGTEGEEV